jgi:hypothetical protein
MPGPADVAAIHFHVSIIENASISDVLSFHRVSVIQMDVMHSVTKTKLYRENGVGIIHLSHCYVSLY